MFGLTYSSGLAWDTTPSPVEWGTRTVDSAGLAAGLDSGNEPGMSGPRCFDGSGRRQRGSNRDGLWRDVPRFSLIASGGWIGSYSSVASLPAYLLSSCQLLRWFVLEGKSELNDLRSACIHDQSNSDTTIGRRSPG